MTTLNVHLLKPEQTTKADNNSHSVQDQSKGIASLMGENWLWVALKKSKTDVNIRGQSRKMQKR